MEMADGGLFCLKLFQKRLNNERQIKYCNGFQKSLESTLGFVVDLHKRGVIHSLWFSIRENFNWLERKLIS